MENQRPYSAQSLLWTGFGLIILLTAGLTITSLYYLVNYGTSMTRTINDQNLKQKHAYTMRTAARERSLNLFAMITTSDPFKQDEYMQALRHQGSNFLKAREKLEQLPLSDQEAGQLRTITRSASNAAAYAHTTIEMVRNRQFDQARQSVMQDAVPEINTLLQQLDQFIALQRHNYQATLLGAASKFQSTFGILMPLGLVTILLIILIAIFVSLKTSQSVTALSDFTARLKQLEKREHKILQGLFDAVVVINEHGIIQDFNNTAEKLFGYSKDEALDHSVNILMPEEHSQVHDHYLKNYTSTGQTKVMGKGRELLGKRKDGSLFPIDVALTEFQLDDSRMFIGTIRDITQQKDNEKALHAAREELEQRVEQRTAELQEANEKLEHLANFDSLTGLPNRLMFTNRFKQELSRARRQRNKLALLFMDLDGFKQVNDSLGHEAGDILLQEVAERLRGVVREEDTIARIGGDEFILLVSNLRAAEDTARIANKIIEALNRPLRLKNHPIDIGVSIGISCFPDDGADTDSLMQQADQAMYQAKKQGKNQYVCLNDSERP